MGEKVGSEKEVQAVMYNIKEQRMLEKSLGTLDLEESYAVKLLNLDYKTIKIRQRRLKNKVNKIKSNLSAEEIRELKMKGIDEKIAKEQRVSQSGGAVRIAAAAKRLKLGMVPREIRRGASRQNVTSDDVASSIEDDGAWAKRSHYSSIASLTLKQRPATSAGLAPQTHTARPNSGARVRPQTSLGLKPLSKSHDIDDLLPKDAQPAGGRSTQRRLSAYSSSSIGDDMRKAKLEEKRQEMLENLVYQQGVARSKCETFMEKADVWVKENPAFKFDRLEAETQEREIRSVTPVLTPMDLQRQEFLRLARARNNRKPVDEASAWKDLSKCRYLRLDADKLDLSGVKTLAIDQLKVMQNFKNAAIAPLTTKFEKGY